MVKNGPCLHCGINSTPLWRNGPAEKPVLCNACGSRYRLRGNLENYLPKNAHLHCLNQLSSHDPHSGGMNPSLWNSKIPSKKRSLMGCKQRIPMEKFRKQLLNLWKCQGQPNESSPEEVLLLHNVNNFIPSNEIGLGGIILKPDVTSTETERDH